MLSKFSNRRFFRRQLLLPLPSKNPAQIPLDLASQARHAGFLDHLTAVAGRLNRVHRITDANFRAQFVNSAPVRIAPQRLAKPGATGCIVVCQRIYPQIRDINPCKDMQGRLVSPPEAMVPPSAFRPKQGIKFARAALPATHKGCLHRRISK